MLKTYGRECEERVQEESGSRASTHVLRTTYSMIFWTCYVSYRELRTGMIRVSYERYSMDTYPIHVQ